MFCRFCGTQNEDDAQVCISCGKTLVKAKSEPQVQNEIQEQSNNKPQLQKKKSKAPIIILIVVLVLALIGFSVWFFLLRDKDYRSIKVKSYEGDVEITRESKEIDITEGMMLKSGDSAHVKSDSMLELLVDSDKHIVANENTKFEIKATGKEDDGKVAIKLTEGDALFTIDNKLPKNASFEVNTPNAALSVRGTTFEVSYDSDNDETIVEVSKGAVAVVAGDEEVLLEAGDSATVIGDEITVHSNNDSDLSKAKVGDIVTFGSYMKTSDSTEPLEWIVLNKTDSEVFLVAKNVIDYHTYSLDGDATWENSEMRRWLNEDFYNIAFSKAEQEKIILSKIEHPDNCGMLSTDTEDTDDYVFLLSLNELNMFEDVNIDSIAGTFYNGTCFSAVADATEYFDDLDVFTVTSENAMISEYLGEPTNISDKAVSWYLRSTYALDPGLIFIVYDDGYIGYHDCTVEAFQAGVRPAIKVSIDSKSKSDTDEEDSNSREDDEDEANAELDDDFHGERWVNFDNVLDSKDKAKWSSNQQAIESLAASIMTAAMDPVVVTNYGDELLQLAREGRHSLASWDSKPYVPWTVDDVNFYGAVADILGVKNGTIFRDGKEIPINTFNDFAQTYLFKVNSYNGKIYVTVDIDEDSMKITYLKIELDGTDAYYEYIK